MTQVISFNLCCIPESCLHYADEDAVMSEKLNDMPKIPK